MGFIMNKKLFRLTESDLHRIVKDAVRRVVNEGFQRTSFEVIAMLDKPMDLSNVKTTEHWRDRSDRINSYASKVRDAGDAVYSFVVDTQHPNGYEIHTITERGFIVIQNERTKKFITILAARPPQIARYWRECGKKLPNDETFNLIMRFAENNKGRGMNNM